MNDTLDSDYVAIDRFMSSIYWADDEIGFGSAFTEALDEWTASAAAEHNSSHAFSSGEQDDSLEGSLQELLAAVRHLRRSVRPGLTVMRAISEAATEWGTPE